jgi:hypothetical protein
MMRSFRPRKIALLRREYGVESSAVSTILTVESKENEVDSCLLLKASCSGWTSTIKNLHRSNCK